MSFNEDLRNRTKKFAVEIVLFFKSLKKTDENRILGKQLLRSATSTAANFRAVSRARSDKERYAKLSIVVEEADETLFWLELFEESGLQKSCDMINYKAEALEIVKILSSYRKKLKQ